MARFRWSEDEVQRMEPTSPHLEEYAQMLVGILSELSLRKEARAASIRREIHQRLHEIGALEKIESMHSPRRRIYDAYTLNELHDFFHSAFVEFAAYFRDDRSQIRDYLVSRGVRYLVHFTRLSNLASILNHGLIPVSMQQASGIKSTANDAVRAEEMRDCTSFSVEFPNYILFWYYQKAFPNATWVILQLDINVIFNPLNRPHFCMENASRVIS